MSRELASLRLPELAGRTVIDVGAWDGFYSFEAERCGASRVVALDHFVWMRDLARPGSARDEAGLPGKAGFDLARETLGSEVEAHVADFASADLSVLDGPFDVALFLGVLYHLQDPLGAMRRLAELTGGMAVIESEAVSFPAHEDHALVEFFAGDALNNDSTNWWVPNLRALIDLCEAAGFARVDVIQGPPALAGGGPHRFRAVVHAWR